jgi:SAM-dependent methyltransferase
MLESQGIDDAGYRCRMDPRGSCGPLAVWSVDALKDLILSDEPIDPCKLGTLDHFAADDFRRDDESPDLDYYRAAPLGPQLDSLAISTVEDLLSRLVPKGARILDLFAGARSYPSKAEPAFLAGIGPSQGELDKNAALHMRALLDLNSDPRLPFGDSEFDAVVIAMAVEYLTRPIEVFREAARALKRGGLFIVVFSNRMTPAKAARIWRDANEADRPGLVKRFMTLTEALVLEDSFVSSGKPRPADDSHYSLGIPSDPIYAVWAKPLK